MLNSCSSRPARRMESTERPPLSGLSETPSLMRGPRRRKRRRASTGLSAAFELLVAPLVQLILLASLARAWPPAVFAQMMSSVVEPSVQPLEEGSGCNITTYGEWYGFPYAGALLDLDGFWIFSDAELTNGQALEVAASTCRVMMDTLRLDRAGRNGPVQDKHIYDVMCAQECTLSDALREEAMELSTCTCMELSTQPSDPTYHTAGDWCVTNTGRILCDTFGQCGAWECRLSDFMCPRYEYNKQLVIHRGKGDCSGAREAWEKNAAAVIVAAMLASAATTVFLWHQR